MKAETTLTMHHDDVLEACREWASKQGFNVEGIDPCVQASLDDDTRRTRVQIVFVNVKKGVNESRP